MTDARDEALQTCQRENEVYSQELDWLTIRDMRAEMELDDAE